MRQANTAVARGDAWVESSRRLHGSRHPHRSLCFKVGARARVERPCRDLARFRPRPLAWLDTPLAWLATPRAQLATPLAWLAMPRAQLAMPRAQLATPLAWLAMPPGMVGHAPGHSWPCPGHSWPCPGHSWPRPCRLCVNTLRERRCPVNRPKHAVPPTWFVRGVPDTVACMNIFLVNRVPALNYG
jgi:hypothetical protein